MTTLGASLNALALTAREGRTQEPLDILGADVLGCLSALRFGVSKVGAHGEEILDILHTAC
jgi:hypothetical protein